MKLTLKALPLIALVTISSSMAATVKLGNVLDLRTDAQTSEYSVTILSAQTRARASDSNSKLLGQWKNCYTRYINSPPMPLQKYSYVPMVVYKDSTALVTADEKTLVINDTLIADFEELENELTQKTDGKCKLNLETRIEFRVELKETKESIRTDVWISKTGNTLTMTYAKWVGGKQGYSATTETLPNKTPVQMTLY